MTTTLRNMTSVYIFKDDRVLLLYRQGGKVVNNVWTGSAGGHFEDHELNNPESCILRYITLRNVKGEIRQNYYYFADLNKDYPKMIQSNEGVSKWFHIDEIINLDMPYTAKYVIEHYLTTGRFSHDTFVGVADGQKVQFVTMSEYK